MAEVRATKPIPEWIKRRARERRQEREDNPHFERQGNVLVYVGPCEPFDAREAIAEVREQRTP